ncbi:hypothetical protein ACC687_37455, partial [Rhizobium ruizarguesonis]
PYFLTLSNLSNIGTNMAFIGLMTAAGTPLIIGGGLDLSVEGHVGADVGQVAQRQEIGGENRKGDQKQDVEHQQENDAGSRAAKKVAERICRPHRHF